MADATRLYYDGRLMNTITSSSKFKTIPNAKVETAEQREEVARKLADGWVTNAGYEREKFKIEHGKSDPMVLSKMTSDIIAKSREGIGTW
jgi:hypothetical protein